MRIYVEPGVQAPQFACLDRGPGKHSPRFRQVYEILGPVQLLCDPKSCGAFEFAVKFGPGPRNTAQIGPGP